MQSYKDFYKTANKKEYEDLAMEYLVTDTLQKRLTGPHKSKQFTAMDMESYSPSPFVPSMFYTFMYTSPTDEMIGNLQFKDRVPLILCTSYEGGYISGINFNLIPCDIRAHLLDLFVSTNPKFYENEVIAAIPDHKFAINVVFANALINPEKRKEILNLLDRETGLKISNCYRLYKEEFVLNKRLIEYDMWKYIPFLTFKDAVRGLSLAELQAKLVNDSTME